MKIDALRIVVVSLCWCWQSVGALAPLSTTARTTVSAIQARAPSRHRFPSSTISGTSAAATTTTTTTRLAVVPVSTVVESASGGGSASLTSLTVVVLGVAAAASVYWNSPKTSNGVRDFWDKSVVQSANNEVTSVEEDLAAKKALGIPDLSQTTSPEQLTLALQSVADTVEKDLENKPNLVERILPKKVSRVFINRNMDPVAPFTPQPLTTTNKSRFWPKLQKKVVMPWRKWKNL
jgi:hypothetical protein